MKPITILIYISLITIGINNNLLRYLQSSTNSYSYTNYKATSIDISLTNQELTNTNADESVVYIKTEGISISNSTLTKESGESTNIENSEFYGVNAAVLVQGGKVAITGGKIETKAKGANALCVTSNGEATISGTIITSSGQSSARGLHATYGGKITASGVTVSSTGGSCATLATDRGEGTVSCTNCNLSTKGAGSPLIYSTGQITVSETKGTSIGAQAVVVEGKNTAIVNGNSELKCNGIGNRGNVDKCGVMLYQSMSGDADSGTSTFICQNSKIEILSDSSVYSSAPMFFVTNTDAIIYLEGCTLNYGSNIFLSAAGTSEWGNSGTNGGVVTLNLKNQNIVGNFVVDANSGLTINMESSTIKGTINGENSAAKLEINLDSSSSIELTGNSYYTSITNQNDSGTNINKGSYEWQKVEEKEISRSEAGGEGGPGGPGGEGGSDRPGNPPGEEGGSNKPGNPPGGEGGSDRPGNPPGGEGGSDRPGNPPGGEGNSNKSEGLESQNNELNNTNTDKGNYIKIPFLLLILLLL